MGKTALRAIEIQGFRSVTELIRIEFPESGMLLFRGFNRDTGGSSGSGKSTVLLAVAYLLGFCPFPATALTCWIPNAPELKVAGEFEVEEGEIVIIRGPKTQLKVNGKIFKGSSKQIEEEIQRLIGLPTALVSALTYRGQKQPGLFLTMGDSEKKEFLTVLLGLDQFEKAVEDSSEREKKLRVDKAASEAVVNSVAAEIRRLEETLALTSSKSQLLNEDEIRAQLVASEIKASHFLKSVAGKKLQLKERQTGIQVAVTELRSGMSISIRDLESKYQELLKTPAIPDDQLPAVIRFKAILVEKQNLLSQARSFLSEARQADAVKLAEFNAELTALEQQRNGIELELVELKGLEQRKAKLILDRDKLAKNLCQTCSRPWEQAEKELKLTDSTLESIEKQLACVSTLQQDLVRIDNNLESLSEPKVNPDIVELERIEKQLLNEIAAINADIGSARKVAMLEHQKILAEARSDLESEKNSLERKVEVFKSNEENRLYGLQDELENDERELNIAQANVRAQQAALNRVQIDNARVEEQLKSIQGQVESLRVREAAAAKSLAEVVASLSAELDFQRLIGREGFLGSIFDEVLAEISEEANRVLEVLPNAAHITLYFRSEAVTQKGKINKEIRPVVNIGGVEAPYKSGCSGGMVTSIELAVDLAVAEVVRRRTGAVPSWMILDESFTGLGPVEMEGAMTILQKYAQDKLVLVVDHASEFKELFTQTVDIEYQNGVSTIRRAG